MGERRCSVPWHVVCAVMTRTPGPRSGKPGGAAALLMVHVLAAAAFGWPQQGEAQPHAPSSAEPISPADTHGVAFAREIDLEAFRLVAVQHDGRIKTFDTLARETVRRVTGTVYLRRMVGEGGEALVQDPVLTYLDLIFRPEVYRQERLLYIKMRPVRQALTDAAAKLVDDEVLAAIRADGRVSATFLAMPAVRQQLEVLSRDILRTAQAVDQLLDVAVLLHPDALARRMQMIPPGEEASADHRWHALAELQTAMPHDTIHAPLGGLGGLSAEVRTSLANEWRGARDAWRTGDARQAGEALSALAGHLAAIAPHAYPPHHKLALEHWYYRSHKMTWVWLIYLAAVIPLLMGIVYRWRAARRTGTALFALAFGLHTVAIGIRWYLAGRIPNTNMFEAIIAAAWLGGALALLLELAPSLGRRSVVRIGGWLAAVGGLLLFLIAVPALGASYGTWQSWGPLPTAALLVMAAGLAALLAVSVARRKGAGSGLAMLGAAVVGMVVMMCGRFMTVALNSDVGPAMPILLDLWLYIHVNMIIASYAVIGIAFVSAAMYVVGRLLTRPTTGLWLAMLLPTLLIPLPALLPGVALGMILPAWLPFLTVTVLAMIGLAVRTIGGRALAARTWSSWTGLSGQPAAMGVMPLTAGRVEQSVFHPAANLQTPSPESASLALSGGTGPGQARVGEQGLAKVLDEATMLLMELAFVMLWAGIIMGAIWADHSWGRPWGWDPKEVFALNTWIIFLILVHVRLKVRDKALWTAVLAVVGCSVMLFNWIVVNFFITGLHSYA